jgi:hypothetical protein
MLFDVEWVESKSADWKIVSVKDINGIAHTDVSVNRVNKSGEAFPGFEAIVVGAKFEADLWANPAGKKYLFAPKPQGANRGGGAPRSAVITAAQDRKAGDIKNAQDNKERAIMVASAMRDATIIMSDFFMEDVAQSEPHERMEAIKATHKMIREWYLGEWAKVEKSLDVPF